MVFKAIGFEIMSACCAILPVSETVKPLSSFIRTTSLVVICPTKKEKVHQLGRRLTAITTLAGSCLELVRHLLAR